MGLLHFYSTLSVQMLSALTAAICLSAYLVSKRKVFAYGVVGFIAYFLDVSFIFQDDYVVSYLGWSLDGIYMTVRSIFSVFAGMGVFGSIWLVACEYIGEKRQWLRSAPCAVFALFSLIALFALPDDGIGRFVFWSMRALFVFWTLGFTLVKYLLCTDDIERRRLIRFRVIYILTWLFTLGFVAFDLYNFILVDTLSVAPAMPDFLGERNYAEEILMVAFAVFAIKSSHKTLALRYEHPPVRKDDERVEGQIDSNLDVYAKRHKLSNREQEVLRYILVGHDNQNIASAMHISPSTAKVHVHNILKKTAQANRQDLIRDFWKN